MSRLKVDAPPNGTPAYPLRVGHINAILVIDMLSLTEHKWSSNSVAVTKDLVITPGVIYTASIQLM
jgi:hypothetical protein